MTVDSPLLSVPQELRDRPQWVLYRIEVRKGKQTKVPYRASKGNRLASATDPSTWATFDDAVNAHRRRRTSAGVGFVFSPDDPYAGLDFDDCRNPATGEIHPAVEAAVAELASYAEISTSGTGLHVIVRAFVGDGRNTSDTPWGGKFELYDRARYFVMTGSLPPVGALAIAERGEQVGVLRAQLLPEPEQIAMPATSSAAPADDRVLLELAFDAKNGAKLRALWAGDTGGYGSDSEADLALCAMLAFWTGPDEARIDRLFRSSGLMRVKWDRPDYRAATIARALNGRTEFYGSKAKAAKAISADPLTAASELIDMTAAPIVAAEEQRGGRVVLRRRDGLKLQAPSLETLAKFDRLSAALAAAFGHELVVRRDEKTATAHRFVAALRRHFGPGQIHVLEELVEGWMIELVRVADEIAFDHRDSESKLLAWRQLGEVDPDTGSGSRSYANKVLLAHDTSTGARYLQSLWAQEYARRCGWRSNLGELAGLLEAVGLERPNPRSNGRVSVRRRSDDQLVRLRFWIIPGDLYEAWKA